MGDLAELMRLAAGLLRQAGPLPCLSVEIEPEARQIIVEAREELPLADGRAVVRRFGDVTVTAVAAAPARHSPTRQATRGTSADEVAELLGQAAPWAGTLPDGLVETLTVLDNGSRLWVHLTPSRPGAAAVLLEGLPVERPGRGLLASGHVVTVRPEA